MAANKNDDLSLGIAILLAILSPSVVLIQAMMSNSPQQTMGQTTDNAPLAELIRPVTTLDDIIGPDSKQQASTAVAAAKTPESLYQGACMACHASGVANAPKLGDNAAWAPKAALGIDSLLQSVINGKGAMPPKGGSAYTDDEIRSVIEYMLSEAGLSG